MERQLPHNIEAEQGVLGSILIDPDAVSLVEPFLHADDFYRDAHRTLYDAIIRLYLRREPADFLTICNELEQRNKLAEVGGASYITSLINRVPTSANGEYYGRIVAQKALHRRLIHAAGRIAALAYEEADHAAEQAEQLIYAVSHAQQGARDLTGVGNILNGLFDDLVAPHPTGGVITGVPCGFPDLDALTGGFQSGNLILLAGRPGMGKTALALSIARNAAIDYGRSTLFFSAEMSQDELTQRLVALEARLDLSRVWKRALTEEERIRLIEVSSRIMDAPILIDDTPAITLAAMRSKIRRALTRGDIDLIIVDYLQKLTATTESGKRYADRVQEVSEIARGLKDIAREFHLPVLALAQLSRAVESRAEKVPQLSDLRDSGELEQEADLVLFLYRDEYYAGYTSDGSSRSARPGSADLICAKHRNGPLGELRLGFAANQTRFYSLERE